MTRADHLRELRRRVRVAALRPGERYVSDVAIAVRAPHKYVYQQLRLLEAKGELASRAVDGRGTRLYRPA